MKFHMNFHLTDGIVVEFMVVIHKAKSNWCQRKRWCLLPSLTRTGIFAAHAQ